MKRLLFLWVSHGFTFKNIGFNFSGKYRIETENDDRGNVSIEISPNPEHIDNFFPEPVKNVIAVIGENGVGKTNLFELLTEVLSGQVTFGPAGSPTWLAIFEDESSGMVERYQIDDDMPFNVKIELTGLPSLSLSTKILVPSFQIRILSDGRGTLARTASIYYSGNFDLRTRSNADPKHIDVSTAALFSRDLKQGNYRTGNPLLNYRYENIKRQYEFAFKFKDQVSSIPIPKHLTVRFEKLPRRFPEEDLSIESRSVYNLIYDEVNKSFSRYNRAIKESGRENAKQWLIARLEKVKVWFALNVFDNFFLTIAEEKEIDGYGEASGRKLELTSDYFDKYLSERALVDPVQLVREFFRAQKWLPSNEYDIVGFYDYVLKLISEAVSVDPQSDGNESSFLVNSNIGISIMGKHSEYLSAMNKGGEYNEGFLNFNWHNMSSGEIAMLDLFSRIYYGLQQIDKENIDSLYILIDEGERGFHPNWQRRYLHKLLTFVKEITKIPIQLFLASHSPFLVSDLPRDNVIFLKLGEEKEGKRVVVNATLNRAQTFASNIHMLFSDSFFVAPSLMSEFAQNKLNELVRKLKDEFSPDRELQREQKVWLSNAKKLIDSVGEIVLREKLKDLFEKKTGENFENY